MTWNSSLSVTCNIVCRAVNSNRTFHPTGGVHVPAPGAAHADIGNTAAGLPPPTHSSHIPTQSSHLSLTAGSSASVNTSHQQELQAKILSLFNSGTGASTGPAGPTVPQSQGYSSLAPPPSQNPPRQAMPGLPPSGAQGFGPPPNRMPVTTGAQRPPVTTSGINFDNPSVQKALDTLIQSGPTLTPLVGALTSQQQPPRQAPGMGQVPSMSMYPPHYWWIVVSCNFSTRATSLWHLRTVNLPFLYR